MLLTDYEKHQTLPYLWYSGAIEEEEFLNIAFTQLEQFNDYFILDETSTTRLRDPSERIVFTLSDLQTLGQSLLKSFARPLTKK